jgi:hypothetical protein
LQVASRKQGLRVTGHVWKCFNDYRRTSPSHRQAHSVWRCLEVFGGVSGMLPEWTMVVSILGQCKLQKVECLGPSNPGVGGWRVVTSACMCAFTVSLPDLHVQMHMPRPCQGHETNQQGVMTAQDECTPSFSVPASWQRSALMISAWRPASPRHLPHCWQHQRPCPPVGCLPVFQLWLGGSHSNAPAGSYTYI